MPGKSRLSRILRRRLPGMLVVRNWAKNALRLSAERVFTQPAPTADLQRLLCSKATIDVFVKIDASGGHELIHKENKRKGHHILFGFVN